jgi:hypothetical protein
MIAIIVAGLAIAVLGIIFSSLQMQSGWKQVDARCIDREIGEYRT